MAFYHINLQFCEFFITSLWVFITNTWLVFNCWFYTFMFNFLIKFLWKFYVNVLFYVSGLVKYDLMRASSYLPLLKELKAKHVCLNIQNNVKKSFLWSILASLHSLQYRNHLAGVWKYHEYEHELNMSGIQYPVDIKHIGKFEHQNNISVKYMSTKIKKNLPITYYHHGRSKTSREFIIYHCRWKTSSRIGERLEQTGIKSI